MNPILLKPEADNRSQLVLRGRPVDVVSARDYYRRKDQLWAIVVEALERLRAAYDAVVIEGAGSPAEVNIKEGDIVNMRVARFASAPVLLVGDIDRGGIFASLLGTLDLLEAEERALVRGLVVNKFRGDAGLFAEGVRFLEERGGVPVLGVIPYFRGIRVADEDSVALDEPAMHSANGEREVVDIAVIRLPHIANFDDFDPLTQEQGVAVRYVQAVAELGQPDLIILPGTKTTLADLRWLRERGLAGAIGALAQSGTPVIGICGGFQMLGEWLDDPLGVEGPPSGGPGLGLLPARTTFAPEKTTCQASAVVAAGRGLLAGLEGTPLAGYEIHMGRTTLAGAAPALRVLERSGRPADDADGALDDDGRVLGSYLHGIFDNAALRRALLGALAARRGLALRFDGAVPSRGEQYDRLAGHVREHLDVPRIYRVMGL
jgi:adenosylcobyric acid synthase